MKATHQIVLASRLRDGRAAFLTAGGQWTTSLDEAACTDDSAQAEALLELARAAEAANLIVDPYLVGVTLQDGRPEPVEWRELIRATGPTVTP